MKKVYNIKLKRRGKNIVQTKYGKTNLRMGREKMKIKEKKYRR